MHLDTNEDFDQIIRGCRKKERISQNLLYRRYYSYGMSICIRYVENESDAIYLVNDGFLKVFRNIKKFDSQRPFKPWFRKIMVNTSINHIKKQKKFKMEVSLDRANHFPATENILSLIGYKELMAMIQSLSPMYRTVFNMYLIDGFKHKEIAAELGISVSTSKSNLTRARAKLREMVAAKMSIPYV